jgi:hypothetical protein
MVYLVPVLQNPLSSPTPIQQIWLFLERNGTHMIEISAEEEPLGAARAFLEANELSPATDPFQVGEIVFCPVDPADKDLAAFYAWREVAPGTSPLKEVWRPFLWVGEPAQADPWGVNRLMEEIPLGPAPHTAYTVLGAFLSGNTTSP